MKYKFYLEKTVEAKDILKAMDEVIGNRSLDYYDKSRVEVIKDEKEN